MRDNQRPNTKKIQKPKCTQNNSGPKDQPRSTEVGGHMPGVMNRAVHSALFTYKPSTEHVMTGDGGD
jgi:hypothetical protein